MKQTSLIILFISITLSGCYFDNEEELYGIPTCDTTNVSFTADIQPIINANCVSCHTAGGSAPGDFTTYVGIKSKVDNGSFNNRVLVQKNMPPSGPLSTCEQTKIQKWIDNGALNN